ncbi:MAG: hypothetical protein ABL930_07055 [Pseudobdellovibrio sp.]
MLNNISFQNKVLAASFVLFLIVYLTLNSKTEKTAIAHEAVYADTLIPKGFVLVPIELANLNAVASLINQFGVIDLYGGDSETNSVQIASRIKILRAPLNPNQYAVLVTEDLSKQIMRFKGPYWAVVQNREAVPLPLAAKTVEPIAAQPNQKFKQQVEIEYYKKEDL